MATKSVASVEQSSELGTGAGTWRGGAVAGALAGIAMGALFSVAAPGVLEVAIPSMYGLSGGLAGWVVHVSHAAVLGVAFVALAAAIGIEGRTRLTGAGAAYGVVLWIALAALVMPVWLAAVGSPATPPLPNLDAISLVAHVVYGVVLGAALPSLRSL